MKTPNFIVIWKDRCGWFLLQEFKTAKEAILAAEDGARREFRQKKVPGQAFQRMPKSCRCAIPRRARALLGSNLRAVKWHRLSRAMISPEAFRARDKQVRLAENYGMKGAHTGRLTTLGECASNFSDVERKIARSKEVQAKIEGALDRLRQFYVHWPQLHEVNYANYAAQADAALTQGWKDDVNPTLEVPNRVSLDDLGKHTTPAEERLRDLIGHYAVAQVDPKALAQSMGRVLRQDGPTDEPKFPGHVGLSRGSVGKSLHRAGPPDVSWKDGSEADFRFKKLFGAACGDYPPLLPRFVEWLSGIVWNWDRVVYTGVWWLVLALLAFCFFLVLTF